LRSLGLKVGEGDVFLKKVMKQRFRERILFKQKKKEGLTFFFFEPSSPKLSACADPDS
jgi:hypothetical protein